MPDLYCAKCLRRLVLIDDVLQCFHHGLLVPGEDGWLTASEAEAERRIRAKQLRQQKGAKEENNGHL